MKKIKDLPEAERRGGASLTENEKANLAKALEHLEKQLDGAVTELFDYDDEYVDILVNHTDDTEEHMAVERGMLDGSKTTEEVASFIY